MDTLNDNNDTNLSVLTVHDEIPTVYAYYSNLTTFVTLSIIIAILLFLLNCAVFFASFSQSLKRVRKQFLTSTLFLLGLYPIISGAALITILVPQSVFICHTCIHLLFTIGVYVFYKLCLLYVEGEDNFLKEADSEAFKIRTNPCCCCCMCLHPMAATKQRMNMIFYMVIQFPCIQFLIMLTVNIIYVYEVEIFKTVNWYLAPFMIASILIAVWGLNIIARMVDSHLENFQLVPKLFALQLILIICKFQFIVLDLSLEGVNLGGGSYPITNTVHKQAITNIAILVEIFALSLFAKHAYKNPTYL